MAATSTHEVIFYILLGLFFAIFFVSTNYFYSGTGSSSRASTMKAIILVVASLIFTFVVIGYASFTGLFKKESYQGFNTYATCSGKSGCCGKHRPGMTYCPSPAAKLCRGGPYMWQGDSERAKFCRNLAKTPEGLSEIQRYECGAGFTGMPGCGFRFTPISDGSWKNKRCDTPASCDIANNGIF